jgi:putative (di)nucleoside polyphosphate hydrolase
VIRSGEAGPDLSKYRPNVGVVLFHPSDGRVWLGRRVGTPPPHNWQFPQGGVDEGEDLYDAALRELAEETGITSVRFLARTEGWITYDFPPGHLGSKMMQGWSGQRQAWFALAFTGEEAEVRLDGHHQVEFDAWRWGALDEAPELVIPFKRAAYEQVVAAFRPIAEQRS